MTGYQVNEWVRSKPWVVMLSVMIGVEIFYRLTSQTIGQGRWQYGPTLFVLELVLWMFYLLWLGKLEARRRDLDGVVSAGGAFAQLVYFVVSLPAPFFAHKLVRETRVLLGGVYVAFLFMLLLMLVFPAAGFTFSMVGRIFSRFLDQL